MVHSLIDDAALAGRPKDLALAYRAALKALEASGDVRDADRSLRELAIAFATVAGIDVVVTTRTNRATATCNAPNCAGHRERA
jgi:hypothetical protein